MQATRFPKVIPLFPLPNVVLFPEASLPLHIFEPRYREMIKTARQNERIIGMTLLKDGWEREYHGNPEIYETGCAGEIISLTLLDDGKYDIVLKGLFKFKIQEQIFEKAFRQGWVEPCRDAGQEASLPPPLKNQLTTLLKKRAITLRGGMQLLALVEKDSGGEASGIHKLCFALPFSTVEKQFLLEAENLVQQARRLIELLQFQIEERNNPFPPLRERFDI